MVRGHFRYFPLFFGARLRYIRDVSDLGGYRSGLEQVRVRVRVYRVGGVFAMSRVTYGVRRRAFIVQYLVASRRE